MATTQNRTLKLGIVGIVSVAVLGTIGYFGYTAYQNKLEQERVVAEKVAQEKAKVEAEKKAKEAQEVEAKRSAEEHEKMLRAEANALGALSGFLECRKWNETIPSKSGIDALPIMSLNLDNLPGVTKEKKQYGIITYRFPNKVSVYGNQIDEVDVLGMRGINQSVLFLVPIEQIAPMVENTLHIKLTQKDTPLSPMELEYRSGRFYVSVSKLTKNQSGAEVNNTLLQCGQDE